MFYVSDFVIFVQKEAAPDEYHQFVSLSHTAAAAGESGAAPARPKMSDFVAKKVG